jgi:hypothetical protein
LLVGVWSQVRVGAAWATASLGADARFDLPPVLAGWEKLNNEASIVERPQTEGAESRVWQYRRGGLIANVAFDYPFNGYHDLTVCYRVSGWSLLDRTDSDGEVRVSMSRPPGLNGLLKFTAIDEQGRWVGEPPPETQTGLALHIARASEYGRAEPSYQVQVLTQSYTSFTDDQRRSLDGLFLAARGNLRAQLLTQLGLPAKGHSGSAGR